MKADCLAIVDTSNETLWVRSVNFALELAAVAMAELRRLTPANAGPLCLIKSFVDSAGSEQFVEIMTPWADACLNATAKKLPAPEKAVVEVWHANTPTFGFGGMPEILQPSEYSACASILVPYSATQPEHALNVAYAASQNIDSGWNPGKDCRSTSVGDVLVLRALGIRQAYVVATIGFKPVQFGQSSDAL